MSDEKLDKKPWRLPMAAWIVGGLLMLYVLGFGPACKLHINNPHPPKALMTFYWPVWQMCRFAFPGKAMAVYLSLWDSRWEAKYWDHHGMVIQDRKEYWDFDRGVPVIKP